MTLSKAGKITLLAGLLCLLLMGFTGASYGQVRSIRWDVFPSPTEVITTGRSEVLGSVSFYVQNGQGTVVTGNSLGGPTQIGITYSNGIQIDTSTGIRVYGPKFATSAITWSVQNLSIIPTPVRCSGFLTLNIPAGVTLVDGDVIRVDGVRGRIDMSDGRNAGTDLFAQMQSINDPSANLFFPETVRIAKSFPGMVVTNILSDTAILCFQMYGKDGNQPLSNYIQVTEGFVRAFVAKDSNIGTPGPDSTDRLDSGGEILGQSSYSTSTASGWATRAVGTRIQVVINTIPASISSIAWPATVPAVAGGYSYLAQVPGTSTFVPGTAGAAASGYAYQTYEYFTSNQAGSSDTNLESFRITPQLTISTSNQSDTGSVKIAASLTGASDTYTTCGEVPQTTLVQPRFITAYQSYAGGPTPETTDRLSQSFGVYAVFAPCVCYMLYPYITSDVGLTMPSGVYNWDTGVSVSNTSDDQAVFGSLLGAPRQTGVVTYYLYDSNYGYVGAPVQSPIQVGFGKSYITLASNILSTIATIPGYAAPSVATFPYVSNGGFHGYMIVKANFQFCHGYAFVADKNFQQIAQGYVAQVIPDPAVKGKRSATAAADVVTKMAAGESLNN